MKLTNKVPGPSRDGIQDGLLSILAPAFALSSISLLGIGSFSLEGFALTQTLIGPWNGLSISAASTLSFLALAAAYFSHDNDIRDFTDNQSYIAYATAGSVALLALSPPLLDAVQGSTGLGWLVFALQMFGFSLITGLTGEMAR